MFKARHMFDYESAAGQAFMKDRDHRLKSYNWTDTGITLTIPDIDKERDLGKYQCDVEIGAEYKARSIELTQIFGQSFVTYNKF